jgi:hypothetical protein
MNKYGKLFGHMTGKTDQCGQYIVSHMTGVMSCSVFSNSLDRGLTCKI